MDILPNLKFKFTSKSSYSSQFLAFKSKFSHQSGFTLIELIVVFSLITILSGIGYAAFADYSRIQELNQNANDIQLFINEARANALSNVTSNQDLSGTTYSCGNLALTGYSVQVTSSDEVEILQTCGTDTPHPIRLKTLPNNLSFDSSTSCSTLSFDALTAQGSGLPCNIIIKGYGTLRKSVCVDAGGNVAVKDSC